MNKPIQLDQIALFSAITKEVDRQATQQGFALVMIPRQMNAVVDAANTVVKAFSIGYTPAAPNIGLAAWLQTDDVGLSSKYMAHVLFNGPICEYNYPRDADDLSRCLKLLESVMLVPKWDKLRASGREWEALATHWIELRSLFQQGNHTQLYELIKKLTK
jgi:hypothetical protein